jgi:hypothetical protein
MAAHTPGEIEQSTEDILLLKEEAESPPAPPMFVVTAKGLLNLEVALEGGLHCGVRWPSRARRLEDVLRPALFRGRREGTGHCSGRPEFSFPGRALTGA